jgi:undecaprenyl pyrophosphate phosphatase UppP
MNYIINRLCEETTWAGIYLSVIAIVVAVIERYNISERNIGYIVAVVVFIAGQILIWTRDYSKTKNRFDDIMHAAARALFKFGKNPDA